MKAAIILHHLFVLCVLSMAFVLGMLFFVVHNKIIDFAPLERYNSARPSIVLDDQGNEWARFALDHRKPITFAEVPEHVVQAFVAAEDWRFFTHYGVSLRGIVRSVLVNMYHGRRVQGASTITQQLVKLLFLEQQKTFERKLKEQLYALLVEQQFTIISKHIKHADRLI